MKEYSSIVKGCRGYDREAQMNFYHLFYRLVYNSSYRVLSDEGLAEDVMQETMLKVLTRTELIKEDRVSMSAFLRRMAINMSIDILRKRRMEFMDMGNLADISTDDSPGELPGLNIAVIKEKIDELAKGLRLILTLHLVEGMDYGEISEILGMTPSAVRTQYARGRKKLAEQLRKTVNG